MTADRELVRRIAAGDEDAFAAFYREHLDAVVAFFHRTKTLPGLATPAPSREERAALAALPRFGSPGGPVVRETARRVRLPGVRLLVFLAEGTAFAALRDAGGCARARAARLAVLGRERPPAVRQAAVRQLARFNHDARSGQTLYVFARAAGARSGGGVGIPVHPGQPLRPGLAMFGGSLYLGIADPRTVRVTVRAAHRPRGLPRRLEVAQGFWAAVIPHGTGPVRLLEQAADGTIVNRVALRG
jgi:hypothetical protein